MVKLLCTSDLHFKNRHHPIAEKHDNLEVIRNSTNVDGILVAGDLTDNGYDGVWFPGTKNELAGYLRWKKKAEKTAPVYACHGNHDTYVDKPYWWQAVRTYIISYYGYTFYHRKINDIHLLVFGMQPMDSKSSVKQLLKKVGNNKFIIMFHYNLVGPWSEFWSESDKRKFYNLIEPKISNLICIVHGHAHSNQDYMWAIDDKPFIRCICVGGPGVTTLEYNDGVLNVTRSSDVVDGTMQERRKND